MKWLWAWVFFGGLAMAQPLKVASLSTVMTDLARQIGGDRVEVVEIVRAGVDPHLFQPSPGDLRKISSADLVLANGMGFESYLNDLKSVAAGARFVVAGDVVEPIQACSEGHSDHLDTHGHDHGPLDPHWWHSVKNTQRVSLFIARKLSEADPAGGTEFDSRAASLDARLEELGRWCRREVARIPRSRRLLVTSHDALGYLARDHGFGILPVQGLSTSDQPSSQGVRALIAQIRSRGATAIFTESVENPKVLEQITAETGARNGGALVVDGLGDGEAATYDGMMRQNIRTIVEALR